MSCSADDTFRIETKGTTPICATGNTDLQYIKNATKALEELHKNFTEQYYASGSATGTQTQITERLKTNPTFYLRTQPSVLSGESSGSNVNRFYTIFTSKTDADPEYRGVVSAIMKGEYDTNPNTFMGQPTSNTNFSSPSSFKGIYGLQNVISLLETKIKDKVDELKGTSGGGSATTGSLSDASKYNQRKGIKDTLEEIARRENQLYREKFLKIILVIVGIILISTQLVQKYFSFSGVGGGGGGGSGLFSGVGFGSSSGGLFSRFGGLGLGSSGRSRIGNLFTNNSYSLTQR